LQPIRWGFGVAASHLQHRFKSPSRAATLSYSAVYYELQNARQNKKINIFIGLSDVANTARIQNVKNIYTSGVAPAPFWLGVAR
jgi:hypothetical protein